jgi:hypothetical protein
MGQCRLRGPNSDSIAGTRIDFGCTTPLALTDLLGGWGKLWHPPPRPNPCNGVNLI